jgi:hypothetical protein
MTQTQAQAFFEAAGFQASSLQFVVKLWVGGIAIICAVWILAGLLKLLDSSAAWDKTVFLFSLFCLSFFITLVFICLA